MAVPGLPFKTVLAFGEETAYGTVVARDKVIEINSETVEVEERKLTSESLFSIGTKTTRVVQGHVAIAGDVVFNPQFGGWERLLKHLLGKLVTTDLGAPDVGAASHVFTPTTKITDDAKTSLTLELDKDKKVFLVDGAKINSMEFGFSAEELLAITMSIIARQQTQTGAPTAITLPTQKLIPSTIAKLKFGPTGAEVELDVTEATITVSNNLTEDRRFIGSRFLKEPVRGGKLDVSGSFTTEFQSVTQLDDFRADTRRSLIIEADSGELIVGGGSQNFLLKIECPITQLLSGTPIVDAVEPITIDHSFKALRGSLDEDEIKITLFNDVLAAAV